MCTNDKISLKNYSYVSFSLILSPPFLPLVEAAAEAAATGRALRSLLSSPLTTTDTRTVLNDN